MRKKHRAAAAASFLVVGLGQIIKGDSDKGLKMMLIFYLACPASLYASLLINGYLFLLSLALVIASGLTLWAYNVWDALNTPLPAASGSPSAPENGAASSPESETGGNG
ncbi:MAG: hypothetical protein JW873_04255 [Candidatus Saganbacteria bacterium]|nr:hypothetical protein [Candidatus Saganbacteria bacterium]